MKKIANNPVFYSGLISAALALSGCSSGDDAQSTGTGRIQLAVSGEDIATDGIAFPDGSEVTIVDGWALELSHVLVTLGNVTLSTNPDLAPSDQSRTGGVIAELDGPWAVDLHVPGTIPGAGGEGLATPLGWLEHQSNGDPFASDERYAFGYDALPASADAEVVNFGSDDDAQAAYAEMIDAGATVMYVGTATFRGTDCAAADDGAYDFSQIPKKVPFRLAFQTPTRSSSVTTLVSGLPTSRAAS